MALIITADEFQEHCRIPGTASIDSYLPSIQDAQDKYISQVLGDELLNDLDAWYNMDDQPDSPSFTKLLPYVQRALVRFTLFIASPEMDVAVTDSGIAVISNGNLAPASSDRVRKYDQSNEERAWDNVETLLKFLEQNKADYPEWVNSSAYTMAIRNMVNSATEYDKIYSIGESRLKFYRMRSKMDDVDNLYIKTVISKELFDRIIGEIKAGSITTAISKIIDQLKRAEVFYTVLESIDRTKYEGTGVDINNKLLLRDIETNTNKAKMYLADVRNILNADPDSYPEYRDSDQFDDTGAPDLYVNTQEAPNYHFR